MRTKHTGYDISEATARYEVIAGNIGSVYLGNDRAVARERMQTYIEQSKSNSGRAGGESVTLFRNDEIFDEYIGTLDSIPSGY